MCQKQTLSKIIEQKEAYGHHSLQKNNREAECLDDFWKCGYRERPNISSSKQSFYILLYICTFKTPSLIFLLYRTTKHENADAEMAFPSYFAVMVQLAQQRKNPELE